MGHPSRFDLGPGAQDQACRLSRGGRCWEGRGSQSTLSLFRSIPVVGMGRGSFEWDANLG